LHIAANELRMMILEFRPLSKVLLKSGSDPDRSSSVRELVWWIPDDDKLLSDGHLKFRLPMRGCQMIRTGILDSRLLMSCLKFKHSRKGWLRSSISWTATSTSVKYALQIGPQQRVSFKCLKYGVALLHGLQIGHSNVR
jgi:hypothetical protein